MKAVRFHAYGGSEVLKIEEIDEPVPGSGQVRIRVRAAAVNPIDWKLRAGYMHAMMPLAFPQEAVARLQALSMPLVKASRPICWAATCLARATIRWPNTPSWMSGLPSLTH